MAEEGKYKCKCKIVSWDEIDDWCRDLYQKISKDYSPDVIIGLTRGGWVPSRILSDYFVLKSLYSVKTEHWGVTANKDQTAILAQPLTMDVYGKKVLVVDDITDTGKSLELALEHIREKNPQELKSATLLHIQHSKIKPDYYTQVISKDDWTWFIFPWNFNEDMINLIPKTLYAEESLSSAQMHSNFKMQFAVRPAGDKWDYAVSETVKKGKLTKVGDDLYKLS